MENVEEETEAAVAREMSRDRERGAPPPEVIDLTEHKLEEELETDRNSSRDGLSPLQLHVSGTRTSLQASPGLVLIRFLTTTTYYYYYNNYYNYYFVLPRNISNLFEALAWA